ncbi:MAG: nucleotidyltransferase, partial [Bacteroidota bacterium]
VNIAHMKDLYALFHNKTAHYSGIITGPKANDISLSSVNKGEAPVGVLYFNKDGYSVYCKEYWQYWDWVEKRNEHRYQNTLAHGKRYDAKNMMHTFRLLYMAEEIAIKGTFSVRRTEDRDFLLKIRSGVFEYDELLEKAEQKLQEIDQLFEQSSLPPATDPAKANALLFRIRKTFYQYG